MIEINKQTVVFYLLSIAIFFGLFKVYEYIFNTFFIWNAVSSLTSILIIIVVFIPSSMILALKLTDNL
ncbi:hypothetical protein [Alkalibacillus haloalkaliphilus]|uniref:hypothetical protein n=1 Tax=Alkalibacillus haloalkaliphilus TaxID=94136 RepID=UPI002936BF09|nr:hypothetical protein [Alkalibacillus haloalkaliphilus]MDV2582918.1 hypothetical protein [Alkalibacillus haloalkaliphilus]